MAELKARELVVGGVTPFTTIDFPGHLAAVVFCQGCSLRCGYCHNQHLLSPKPKATEADPHPWPSVLDWLESRRGLLDGVVFSGGEPLLQRVLPQAVKAVRRRGFAVALHTAGTYPERLRSVLPDLDWIGFDIKAPFDDYARITGANAGKAAEKSLTFLLSSGRAYEVRCTVDNESLAADDVARLAQQLAAMGVSRLVLQSCRQPGFPTMPPSQRHIDAATTYLSHVELRTN